MAVGKLTSKGQITIPKEVRETMGLKTGDKVEFIFEDNETVIRRAPPKENVFKKYQGIARGAFKSREEINAWIADMRGSE